MVDLMQIKSGRLSEIDIAVIEFLHISLAKIELYFIDNDSHSPCVIGIDNTTGIDNNKFIVFKLFRTHLIIDEQYVNCMDYKIPFIIKNKLFDWYHIDFIENNIEISISDLIENSFRMNHYFNNMYQFQSNSKYEIIKDLVDNLPSIFVK